MLLVVGWGAFKRASANAGLLIEISGLTEDLRSAEGYAQKNLNLVEVRLDERVIGFTDRPSAVGIILRHLEMSILSFGLPSP